MRRIVLIVFFFLLFMPTIHANVHITNSNAVKITDWTFYKDALLMEEDHTLSYEEVTIPHQWGNLFQGKNGHGTYVTTVSFSDLLIGEQYAMHIPYTSTAYTLYFNGVKQTSLGKVATNVDDYIPKQQVKTHYFTITSNELVIALQVANYSNMIGGATRDITIGPRNVVNQQYQAYTNKEYFILGSFLFMVLNVFSLYYFRRKDRSYLWVGLLGSFLIIWYVFSKDHLIMDLFPEMSWSVMTKIELLVIFLAFTCYNYYISVVYTPYYNEKIPHYSFISFVVIAALAIFIPTTTFATIYNLASVTIVLFAMHVLYMSYCSVRDKRPYAVAIALTNMAFFVPFVQDMLYLQGFVNTNYYSIYGFMFFAAGYLITLNHQHTKKYIESEMYNAALQQINHGLEEKVEERTRELREKNHQLELLTVRDGLTNIANRRYFDQQLAVALRKVKLDQATCSLILFDIDFFKKYNDYYGHLGGDDGTVARYGGEEFAVIVPNKSLDDAYILARFIRDSIAAEQIERVKSEALVLQRQRHIMTQSSSLPKRTQRYTAGRNAVLTTKELRINEDYMS